jgi:surfeit locus 1 family protein
MIAPLLFGLIGTAVLIALGLWQLQRLDWKRGILDSIGTRLAADAVAVPPDPTPAEDQYRRVETSGVVEAGEIHVYTAAPSGGVGYRIVAPFTLADGRRILLDRGFVPIDEKDAARPVGPVSVAGSLLWPDDGALASSPPDLARNIWIARDLPAMAAELGTEPVLIVAAAEDPPGGPDPLPVTVNIPNNHLEYAVTWFGLAAVWAGMTLWLLWRINRRLD